MGRKREKEQQELPKWTKEQQWYESEEAPWYRQTEAVPVEEPKLPWYMEEAKANRVEFQTTADELDKRYFLKLISTLDDKGWTQTRIRDGVVQWLDNPDHYRFVAVMRTDAQDWVNALVALGVKENVAFTIRAAIEEKLPR